MRYLVLTVVAVVLAGCGDPLRNVDRLDDVELAEETPVAQALPEPAEADPERGFFSDFFGRRTQARKAPDDGAVDAGAEAIVTKAATPQILRAQNVPTETVADQASNELSEDVAVTAATTPQRRGFFGRLRSGPPNDAAGAETASLVTQAPRRTPRAGRAGFGARGDGPSHGAPDYEQVGPGATLPYGRIARLCGVSASRLGTQVARYPESGRGGFVLYDTEPGNISPHTFFVTGFDDGCARQFTAALALFGAPSMHEQLRYGAPGGTIPVSDTDRAYEVLKGRICRVPSGRPCGRRIDQIDRSTAFLSIYERFGNNARWKTILLHDGAVLALDIKGG